MSNELKPKCPICGHDSCIKFHLLGMSHVASFECRQCGYFGKEAEFNNRTQPPQKED